MEMWSYAEIQIMCNEILDFPGLRKAEFKSLVLRDDRFVFQRPIFSLGMTGRALFWAHARTGRSFYFEQSLPYLPLSLTRERAQNFVAEWLKHGYEKLMAWGETHVDEVMAIPASPVKEGETACR